MKNSLFSENALKKIQKIRKIFLMFAVWILIAEFVFGVFLILTESWNIAIGRAQSTFLVLALILFLSVNNFIRIEKGNKTTQAFALIGFISNIIWGIIAFLLMWEIVPFLGEREVIKPRPFSDYSYYTTESYLTIWAKAMLISSYAAVSGFFISNVLSIKETTKVVKPLKITAVVCVVYLWIFGTIMTMIVPEYKDTEKLYQLAGLAGLAFDVTALAAVIISKTNKKKVAKSKITATDATTQFIPKTDEEIRAEIEEKVRREMIEKEVRAKMEAEKTIIDSPSTNSEKTIKEE